MKNQETATLKEQLQQLQREKEQLIFQQEARDFRYKELEKLGNVGSWELDLTKQTLHWSEGFYKLLGIALSEKADMKSFTNSMKPEDAEKLNGAIKKVFISGEPYSFEHQVIIPQKPEKDCVLTLELLSKDGKPVKLIGIVRDVTTEKQAEEENRKLSLIAAKTSNAALFLDKNTNVEWVNDGFVRMLGYTMSEVKGKSLAQVLSKCSKSLNIQEFVTGNIDTETREIAMTTKKGATIWGLLNITANLDFELITTSYTALIINITKRKKAQTELLELNHELAAQRDQLITQKEDIEKKNKKITDSILYAKRIQDAMLKKEEVVSDYFEEVFICNAPRDVVSGDFYWFTELENGNSIIAVGDCTGHGVPGAFMTVLANSLLNQLVLENGITSPNEILTELDKKVQETLRTKESYQQDGMDMAVLFINTKDKKATFAGAMNPLVFCRDGKAERIKGSTFPIGSSYFNKEKIFKNKTIDCTSGDCLYLFSDGFQDQFGERINKKYMSKRFRNLLESIHQLPMEEQKAKLLAEFTGWKGNVSQTDDVMIVGIKF